MGSGWRASFSSSPAQAGKEAELGQTKKSPPLNELFAIAAKLPWLAGVALAAVCLVVFVKAPVSVQGRFSPYNGCFRYVRPAPG